MDAAGRSGFRLGQRQRNRGLARIQQAVFPRDLIAVAGDHADVVDLRFKTIQFVDDLDALDLRQAKQVLFMVVKSERKLCSDIRRAARLIRLLEPKQHDITNKELHRFVAVDHMDGIVIQQRIVRAFDESAPRRNLPGCVCNARLHLKSLASQSSHASRIADTTCSRISSRIGRTVVSLENRHARASLVLMENSRGVLQKQPQIIHAFIQARRRRLSAWRSNAPTDSH